MQQRQIDIALFHRIIDVSDIFPVELAGVRQEIGLRDRVSWDLPTDRIADEVIDVLRTAIERLVRIWIGAMDQVDVDLYGVRLRFVMWTKVAAEA